MLIYWSFMILWALCEKPMRERQKALFCWLLFCGGVSIGVVEWSRNSHLGPAETESFVYWFSENPAVQGEHLAIQLLWFWCWSRKRGEVSPRFFVRELESLGTSPQTYRERGGVIWRVLNISKWLNKGGGFLFYWGLMLLWETSAEFENTCTVSGR